MKLALVDLGSNTIKMAIYEIGEDTIHQVHYEARYTKVISYISGDMLTTDGTAKIIDTLKEFQGIAKEWECEQLECFSTASLREIINRAEVIRSVEEATGIQIEAISGKREAFYNYLSMRLVAQTPDFVGGDLGGGSMQVFLSQDDDLEFHKSFPLGALKLYGLFVGNTFPTQAEAEHIRAHVRQTLTEEKKLLDSSATKLYFMGGTARLIHTILGLGECFQTTQMDELLDKLLADAKLAKQMIEETVPERKTTLIPGMLAISELCRVLHISEIQYTQNSVREGYLYEHYIN